MSPKKGSEIHDKLMGILELHIETKRLERNKTAMDRRELKTIHKTLNVL